MKQIKSVNYTYSPNGAILECTVIYSDLTQRVFKTIPEFIQVQEQIKNQQKQFLVE